MDSFVRAAALTHFAEVSATLGYNADAALRRAGLQPRVLQEPELRLPAEAVVGLLEAAARATGCETFGLRMVQSRQLSNFGVVSLLLAHQGSLRGILTATIEHLHLLNNSLAMQMEDAGPLVFMREEVMSAMPARQSIELAIGVIHRTCAALMGEGWRPRSVNFSHAAPASLADHHQVFRCPVEFNADFNGMVFRAADLDVPNPTADPGLARYAKTLLENVPSPVAPPANRSRRAWAAACAPCSASWTRRAPASPRCWPRCGKTWRSATSRTHATAWPTWPSCWATARTAPSRAGSRCSSASRRPPGAASPWRPGGADSRAPRTRQHSLKTPLPRGALRNERSGPPQQREQRILHRRAGR